MVELDGLALAMLMVARTFSQDDGRSLPFVPTAPPELRASWLFVIRAALPARWPSELA